jgi:hypothetical protein
MCEFPKNVILTDEFVKRLDGLSIVAFDTLTSATA